ncbi:MAG: tRNA (adenosine(37)-N6)-threonylcarbamoyltransferase complex ATPase subunit type 1 TsaE [Deltaproteobacteria bacterium]|nr:tRNA (adenosine(37)-N6)-threonylcarbamoyltransferase complex ATPase subunit type 1 TsaE [Deltaproteobacteria bacterium]
MKGEGGRRKAEDKGLKTKTFESAGAAFTGRLGFALGRQLNAGAVVGLIGELGTGKTVFVRGLARGLGLRGARVVSPTFTLVNEYLGKTPLYHFDLYRLGDPSELDSIDYRKYLSGGVCAVEWFERFPDAWPADAIVVRFEYLLPRRRTITISGESVAVERLKVRV